MISGLPHPEEVITRQMLTLALPFTSEQLNGFLLESCNKREVSVTNVTSSISGLSRKPSVQSYTIFQDNKETSYFGINICKPTQQ